MRRSWRLMAAFALVLAAGSFLFSAWLFTRISTEGAQRRDQTCRLLERQYLVDVTRLTRTYQYLRKLPRSEWGSTLTVAIVRGLRDQERDAEASIAPKYCDAPHVGLPEPDLEPPPHHDFSRLLHKP